MYPLVVRLIPMEVIGPDCTDDFDRTLGVSSFEVNRLACVGQVSNAEIALIQLFYDLVVYVPVILASVDDHRDHAAVSKNRSNALIVELVRIRLVERHRDKAPRFSLGRHQCAMRGCRGPTLHLDIFFSTTKVTKTTK